MPHTKHQPGSFRNPHPKRTWLPDLPWHRQKKRAAHGKGYQDELDERTKLIKEEILDKETPPNGTEQETPPQSGPERE